MKRLESAKKGIDPVVFAHFFDKKEGTHLSIQITDEGVIMDCYAVDPDGNDQVVGTFGMMASEIFDWLTEGSGGMLERTLGQWTDSVSDDTYVDNGRTEAQDGE